MRPIAEQHKRETENYTTCQKEEAKAKAQREARRDMASVGIVGSGDTHEESAQS